MNFNATACTSEGYFHRESEGVYPIFSSCSNLSKVTFGNNVVTIPALLLDGCESLKQVTIGENVTSIGKEAFKDCSGLTSVTSLKPVPPTCGKRVFRNVDTSICTLYVPKDSKKAYSNTREWEVFKKIEYM